LGARQEATVASVDPPTVGGTTVGIIANPASGKDIRRLTAHGSVFDNNEKVNIVRRVLLGLEAAGVSEVLYMVPDIKGPLPEEEFLIPLGQADVKRPGKDVTVITYGFMVYKALAAAGKLSQEGIEVEVVDPRTLSPLDRETLASSVKKTHKAVVVHEAPKTGGFGGELVAVVTEDAFDYLDAPILRVAAPDTPIPFSPPMEKFYFPDEDRIVEGVKKVLAA
jgi:pyruvate/2-oxoglutarate/acetoin dehydrogenase E1 component